MNQQPVTTNSNHESRRDALIGGGILILVGLATLFGNLLKWPEALGEWFLLGLGACFLVWGLLARHIGPIIPGGILAGLGTGVMLVTGPYAGAPGETTGAIVLLSFAGGWVLITVLSALIRQFAWWPLIPGAIIGFIGAALIGGETGLQVLEIVGRYWAVILVALGVYLIFKRGQ